MTPRVTVSARTRRNVKFPYEKSWLFLLVSLLLGYNPGQKQRAGKKKKTGDFFSCFQVTVHHQGMSEKKPRGRKWSVDPGGVLLTLLLPSSHSATILTHPRHTSAQAWQGHCAPLQWVLLHQLAINEMPHRHAQRPIQLSFFLRGEHNRTKISPENCFSYEYG